MSGILFFAMLSISLLTYRKLQVANNRDLQEFQSHKIDDVKLRLKELVGVIYSIIETDHRLLNTENDATALEIARKTLGHISFNRGEGYFWVTDDKEPYPTMIIHREWEGKLMDSVGFELVVGKDNRNVFQERTELSKQEGEAFVEYYASKTNSDRMLSYSRIYRPLGWIITTEINLESILRTIAEKERLDNVDLKNTMILIILIVLVSLTTGFWVIHYQSGKLVGTIKATRNRLQDLSDGKIVDKFSLNLDGEIGEMTNAMDELVDGLATYAKFAKEVGEGNLDFEFQPLSKDDITGNEMLKMRDSLKSNAGESKIRSWTTNGIAKFGNVLRKNNDNLQKLCEDTIIEFVKYLKANQGSFFLMEEDEENPGQQYLELVAAYAYDRRKYMNRRVDIGEGLLGQVVLEKEVCYMEVVPEDFIVIRSGLGDAPPRSILILPLMLNKEVFGVIEVASFTPFEQYKIDFCEQLGENIASVISSVKTNENTKSLLETSQLMSESLKSQEEEMRQNMEELSATQEEMQRRQAEMEAALEQSYEEMESAGRKGEEMEAKSRHMQEVMDAFPYAVCWKDRKSVYQGCNKEFSKLAGLEPKDIQGKSDAALPWEKYAKKNTNDDREVMDSETAKMRYEEVLPDHSGKEYHCLTSKVPLRNEEGVVYGILVILEDIG